MTVAAYYIISCVFTTFVNHKREVKNGNGFVKTKLKHKNSTWMWTPT